MVTDSYCDQSTVSFPVSPTQAYHLTLSEFLYSKILANGLSAKFKLSNICMEILHQSPLQYEYSVLAFEQQGPSAYLRSDCIEECGTAGVIDQFPPLLNTSLQCQSADLSQAQGGLVGSATGRTPQPQHFLWRFGTADLVIKRCAFEREAAFFL